MPGEAIAEAYDAFAKGKIASPMTHAAISSQTIQESMRLILMVRSYQVRRVDGGRARAGGQWRAWEHAAIARTLA